VATALGASDHLLPSDDLLAGCAFLDDAELDDFLASGNASQAPPAAAGGGGGGGSGGGGGGAQPAAPSPPAKRMRLDVSDDVKPE
jgi:hypothetical protein